MRNRKELISALEQRSLAIEKRENGITLIALVVTIVVLLILAGITIASFTGDEGIFNETKEIANSIEDLQNKTIDDLHQIANELSSSAGDALNPGEPGNPDNPGDSGVDTPIEEIKSDWVTLGKIAEQISKDSSVNADSTEATAVVDGKKYTIKVGDIFEVEYDGVTKPVRVLGFKHDTLVKKYDGTENSDDSVKAGITFDFVDLMTGTNTMNMHNYDTTNSGGWARMKLRQDLNGYTSTADAQSGAIGGLGAKLSNKDKIKQVKKDYITTYNTGAQSKCQDYLWLLSSAEIVSTGETGCEAGRTKTREGSQYPYYKEVTTNQETGEKIPHNARNPALVKKGSSSDSGAKTWWLRSPDYRYNDRFCTVDYYGNVNGCGTTFGAGYGLGVAPGFAI